MISTQLNETSLSLNGEGTIDQLPSVLAMQRFHALNDQRNGSLTQKMQISSTSLKMLNRIVEKFPAQEIYQIGKELGEREFRAFYLAFVPVNPSLLDLGWKTILERWWVYAYLSEYGNVNLELSQEQNDYFFVTFTNTKIHRTKATKNKPVCPLIAGVLAGFFSSLSGYEYEAIETECHEKGHQNCTFILGNSGLVNSETFWQAIHDIY